SRSGKCLRERGEDAEVGVQLHAVKPSHTERGQAAFVLQASEGTLDRGTASVKVTPPLRLTRDQRVQARRLAPQGLGLALTGRTAPLRLLPVEVSPGERPRSML